MFENFSFGSHPSRGTISPPVSSPDSSDSLTTLDDSIEMISPFSSRCASPFPSAPRQYPTSNPRQLSITSLTNKLHAHSLYQTTSHTSTANQSYYSYHSSDEEEGYSEADSDSLPTPPLSALDSPTSQAAYFDIPPTSAPSQNFSLTRRNRSLLTRLQCSVSNAVHLAMLIEEQHPSGMPLPGLDGTPSPADVSPEWRRVSVASARKVQKVRSRKGSVASLKAQEASGKAMVKKQARMRRGTGGSASGAGRR